jgi:hypothetical protein
MPTSTLGLGTIGGSALSSASGTGVTLDMSTVQSGLKELYGRANWLAALYEHDGLFTRIPKFEGFTGSYYPVVVQYAPNSRRSQDFTRAQDNDSSFEVVKFLCHRNRDYAFARLDTETILSTRGDAGAFASYMDVEISGARYALRRSLARQCYGDGSGKIGVVTSSSISAPNTTITLSNANDIVNFEVGQHIEAVLNADYGSAATGYLKVSSVNREAGTFVASYEDSFDADNAVIGGGKARLFMRGDSAASAASANRMSGLDAWIPATAPTSGDSFFGVDRSKDVTRLAGHRFTGATTDIYHAFVSASERMGREGAKPDHIFCDYSTYTSLMKEVTTAGNGYSSDTNKGLKVDIGFGQTLELGFTNIVIHLPTGPVQVVPDADAPVNTAYMIKLSDWELASLGMCPQILDLDGQQSLRISNRDSYEVRLGSYSQILTRNPGNQCRIDFS